MGDADGRSADQLARPVPAQAGPARSVGRAYLYCPPGRSIPNGYDLLSYGADGQPGGNGEDADITSWQ